MMRWIGILFLLLTALTRVDAQQLTLDARAIERGREYQRYFEEAGERYGVDPRLLWTISYLETRHNPKLISPKGARGLMQLMPATARRFGAVDPFDPRLAIEAAAKYLAYLQRRFPGRLDLVLAAYNAGETAVEAYKSGRSIQIGKRALNPMGMITSGIPPYTETQSYVQAGLQIFKILLKQPRPQSMTIAAHPAPIRKSFTYRGKAEENNSSTSLPMQPRRSISIGDCVGQR
jgi:soluble lytic murein transglycosylase-like protein